MITAYENGGNATLVECQLAKLQLDVGSAEAERVGNGVTDSLVADIEEAGKVPTNAQTLPEYLAERGYTC